MTIRRYLSILALTFATLGWQPAAFAAPDKDRAVPADAQVQANVEHQISKLGLDASHVSVAVQDGVVMLSGTVPSAWVKQQAIERTRKTAAVQSVVSGLSLMRAESDQVLVNEIAKRIRQYAFYTVYDDVTGVVQDGVVTLHGKVTMPHKATDIADLVARVPGVREVDNQIQTLPVSRLDDQLRRRLANRIYRDPLFWEYAIQANPPLHIVVENGHVRLTGVVNSEVERRKAAAIAETTSGVFSVENDLRLDSETR